MLYVQWNFIFINSLCSSSCIQISDNHVWYSWLFLCSTYCIYFRSFFFFFLSMLLQVPNTLLSPKRCAWSILCFSKMFLDSSSQKIRLVGVFFAVFLLFISNSSYNNLLLQNVSVWQMSLLWEKLSFIRKILLSSIHYMVGEKLRRYISVY